MSSVSTNNNNVNMQDVWIAIKGLLLITFVCTFDGIYLFAINLLMVDFPTIHKYLYEIKDIVQVLTAVSIFVLTILKIRKILKDK